MRENRIWITGEDVDVVAEKKCFQCSGGWVENLRKTCRKLIEIEGVDEHQVKKRVQTLSGSGNGWEIDGKQLAFILAGRKRGRKV